MRQTIYSFPCFSLNMKTMMTLIMITIISIIAMAMTLMKIKQIMMIILFVTTMIIMMVVRRWLSFRQTINTFLCFPQKGVDNARNIDHQKKVSQPPTSGKKYPIKVLLLLPFNLCTLNTFFKAKHESSRGIKIVSDNLIVFCFTSTTITNMT